MLASFIIGFSIFIVCIFRCGSKQATANLKFQLTNNHIRCFDLTTDDEILAELKKIREAVEKAPPPTPPKGLWKEFLDFLSKYKIMGLAVAFVIGLYLGSLVQALVKDLFL